MFFDIIQLMRSQQQWQTWSLDYHNHQKHRSTCMGVDIYASPVIVFTLEFIIDIDMLLLILLVIIKEAIDLSKSRWQSRFKGESLLLSMR
jgi:hypothetical protein